ncbi:hypothetical protein AWH62_13135 [Maricaulis sp. W15]|uniref:Glycerophosphoryl diester phosphodiesterase membrane domain-containing protein n=1 Tax=Maricaulis maris TaxID=74318 RepID=A0A495D389_9PROT|nr:MULTISPECIES: hypothetical protein [Maricaulis]OLF71005.1 hypothetical protein AWH62_13135 [Maricaulis sp. W15]RKQ96238.1 hypothetical protein C7435_2490 [Maricaulis maris]
MTDTNPTPTTQAELGIGRILGGTFKLYFSNFPLFFGVVFLPYALFTMLVIDPVNRNFMASTTNPLDTLGQSFMVAGLSMILIIFLQAIIVRMSISLNGGQGPQLGAALRGAVTGFLPIIILGIVAGIATGIGFILLIVPGLYVLALLYVYVPAIVFEKAGFSALGRSEDLTKGYRWAIVGVILVIMVLTWIISAIYSAVIFSTVVDLGAVVDGSTDPAAIAAATPWWLNLVASAVQAVTLPITLIASGLVYARLREIKEGGSTSDLLRVFE